MTSDLQSLPIAALAPYLESHVPGFQGPLTAQKFKGGQSNPTYLIDAPSGPCVLRRKPPGKLLASAHAIDREFRVLQALHGASAPVAKPIHFCSDASVIGSEFYVMEFLEGDIYWNPLLPNIEPSLRAQYFNTMLITLANLHGLDTSKIGLGEYGRPGNYFSRQIKRWSDQYVGSHTRCIEPMNELMRLLPERCPEDDGRVALVHGDFRIDNLMFVASQPRVRAIMDWELSTLGHPMADLGYLCMALRLPQNRALPGLAGVERGPLGIPSEEQMLSLYCELTHIPKPSDWNFVLAFSFFRLAAIAQGVAKRAEQGNASSPEAVQAGAMTELLASMGVDCLF
jgi:aminoglycoside phosphotransferase (APT) family kinase protein